MQRLALAAILLASGPAAAQSLVPGPNQPGRYEMQPVEGGVARLDTVTGDVSLCRVERGALRCRPSEDADAADEATAGESKDPSRRDFRNDDEDDRALGAEAGRERTERNGTDAELDRAIGRVKRVFRAFRDIARDFDREDRETTAPDRT